MVVSSSSVGGMPASQLCHPVLGRKDLPLPPDEDLGPCYRNLGYPGHYTTP